MNYIEKKILMALVLFLIVTSSLLGWTKTYGGNGVEEGNFVQQTSDGGYIVAGYTDSWGAGSKDVYLVKTDENGDTLLIYLYGGTNDDYAKSVQQTSDGGYIIVGYSNSPGAADWDIYLIKTDAIGSVVWEKYYGGTGADLGISVKQTNDGGYIIAGYTESYGAGQYDIYLVKTDANGNTTWTKTFGGSSYDFGYSIEQTSDNGFIISGFTESYGAGGRDFYLIKTDANGIASWTKTFGGFNNDGANSVQQTSDGGYIIAGYTESYGAGSSDIYLIKTDANGIATFVKTFGGSNNDAAYSTQQTSDGGYIIAGYTESYGAGSNDFYLIKTDNNGITSWTETYGGNESDVGRSVQQTNDGGYIVSGYTASFGAGSRDIYLIKTDANGSVVEESVISTPEKFSYCINQISNNYVTLQFSLPMSDRVEINIYDAAGRFISNPIMGFHQAGIHSVNFKVENNGVYFFNIITNRCSETGKFLVF